MIKVKKILSLAIVFLLILTNAAFAQYSNPSQYEGKPIDESREGDDYYREGQIIIYPHKMSSKEGEMMERFRRGEASEDEMRAMAKAKFADKFSEMEFQKGMIEFNERMKRKETFSYEHKGFEYRYDIGPSYEGYSKEHMVFGMIFEHIGEDIDPREIKKFCEEPNKIAGIIINKLKDKIGDLQKICSKAEEHESKCAEYAKKGCSQLATPIVREDATEFEKIQSVAYSCPVNKDAIIEACKLRSKFHIEQNLKYSDESCQNRFDFEGERLLRECERFRQHTICDREKFIGQCMGGIKKEEFEKKPCPEFPVPQCGESSKITTKTDANGCVYYYCEGIACPKDVKQCPDGSYVKRIPPNCEFEECPITTTTCPPIPPTPCAPDTISKRIYDQNGCVIEIKCEQITTCPEPIMPICASGQIIEKKIDEKGCVYYYCATVPCPTVQKPTCNADETLQPYYDNAGCTSSYQCIKQQKSCPDVSRPTCAEGQSLTTRYDDKGCIVGYECVSITATGSVIAITGKVVLNTYDDFLRNCENSWQEQQRVCSNIPDACDKNTFIEKCKDQEKKNYEDSISKIEQHCKFQTAEIEAAEQRCARIDNDRERCLKDSLKQCEHMKGTAQQCKDLMTEENLRKFIVEEVKKRCKFSDIIQDEDDVRKAEKVEIVLAVLNTATKDDFDKLELFVGNLKEELKLQDTTVYKGTIDPNRFGDVKLLPFVVNAKISTFVSSERAKEVKAKIVARLKVEEAASKLVSLRDSDVPKKYLYIIEDKASDVLNVSDELEEIEKKEDKKGFGYKLRLFLGLAKRAEQEEIKQLGESKEKLKNSIEVLTKLIDEIPSDVAKVILKEQVENLKEQQEDIEVLIETKEKKAKGFFGIFG